MVCDCFEHTCTHIFRIKSQIILTENPTITHPSRHIRECINSLDAPLMRRTLLKRTLIKGVHLQVTSGCL